MTNTFYNYSDGVPAAQTRATSSLLRSEFALIASGFDGIGAGFNAAAAATALKGNINNQAWQGVHDFSAASLVVPTPLSATAAATKAYVDTLVTATAFSAALPNQAGNAGKFIATDGSNANWVAVPSVAQNLYLNSLYGAF